MEQHWDLGNRGDLPEAQGLAAQVPIPTVTVASSPESPWDAEKINHCCLHVVDATPWDP